MGKASKRAKEEKIKVGCQMSESEVALIAKRAKLDNRTTAAWLRALIRQAIAEK